MSEDTLDLGKFPKQEPVKQDSRSQIAEAMKNLRELNPEKPIKIENSGGFVNYYLVDVPDPQRGTPAYQAECEDIIEALELNPDEANIFMEIWRTARSRQGFQKKGQDDVRAAEKIIHSGKRMLRRAKRKAGIGSITI